VLSSDLTLVAVGSQDGMVELWDCRTDEIWTLPQHDNAIQALAFSPTSNLLASSCTGGGCRIWNVSKRCVQYLAAFEPANTHSIAFSHDGLTVALTGFVEENLSSSGTILLKYWDMMTGQMVDIGSIATQRPNSLMAITLDLDAIAVSDGVDVRIIKVQPQGLEIYRTLRSGQSDLVMDAVFSRDGKLVASNCQNFIRLWDMDTGECRVVIKTAPVRTEIPTPPPMFSPNGQTLAAWCLRDHDEALPVQSVVQEFVGIWNVSDGQCVKVCGFDPLVLHHCIAFSPDGRTFVLLSQASTSFDNFELTTWDATSPSKAEVDHPNSITVDELTLREPDPVPETSAKPDVIPIWDIKAAVPKLNRSHGVLSLAPASTTELLLSGGMGSFAFTPSYDHTDGVWNALEDMQIHSTVASGKGWPRDYTLFRGNSQESTAPADLQGTSSVTEWVQKHGDNMWVFMDSEPVLFIHPQFRVTQVLGEGRTVRELPPPLLNIELSPPSIVLGLTSGQVSTLEFNFSEMMKFRGKNLELLSLLDRAIPPDSNIKPEFKLFVESMDVRLEKAAS
jgi:WD40 repeat protein